MRPQVIAETGFLGGHMPCNYRSHFGVVANARGAGIRERADILQEFWDEAYGAEGDDEAYARCFTLFIDNM